MKLLSIITAAIISTVSFSALSAMEVDRTEVNSNNYTSLGVVSTSQARGGPADVEKSLREKAIKKGASYYRIIGIDTPGDSSLFRASAEIYR